jgi:DnaJ-class molecular chaperone
MMNKEYWAICLEEILEDHGVEATSEQIEAMAKDFESCASVQGDYSSPVENPTVREADELRKQLKLEQSKVFCVKCQGAGRIVDRISSSHVSDSSCWKCNGAGKL